MRPCILLIMIFYLGFSARAQVSISLQDPPPGIVTKQQLWNVSLVNAGNSSVTVRIGISLVDARERQPFMTAISRPIVLNRGIKNIKLADVSPVDYQYSGVMRARISDMFLPVGQYQACYTVYRTNSEAQEILAEDCMGLDVSPISPPQLALPADSAKLTNPVPQFSWLPPTPQLLFNDLNYDLIVTEVREDQTAQEAIQDNLPIYFSRRLPGVFSAYPASARKLDTGKVYAWRVIAKEGEMFAAQSEVWTFSLSPDKPKREWPQGGQFLSLNGDPSIIQTGRISNRILGIRYYSYDSSHQATLRFLDGQGKVVQTLSQVAGYGDNFWVFKLDSRFEEETVYFVEYLDVQANRHRISFRIVK